MSEAKGEKTRVGARGKEGKRRISARKIGERD